MATRNKNTASSNDNSVVFRLQNDKVQHGLGYTQKDWSKSKMYDETAINAIESSNKSTLNEPTSIPSPFARIALAKTAFAEVAEHGENTSAVYQKIVSDCLDVAEIFFTFDKWENQLSIIKWDKDSDLEKLKEKHFPFYKTLKTYLETDAAIYNFDRMKCIYILRYLANDGAVDQMIGATSPCTLFFSSANEYEGKDIMLSNNHKAFHLDGGDQKKEPVPLSQRSWEFQKFLYVWMSENNESIKVGDKHTTLFPDIQKYLEKQKAPIKRYKEIDNAINNSKENIAKYADFSAENAVEILGKNYKKQIIEANATIESEFEIATSIYTEERKPLVLPLEGGNGVKYHTWRLTEITVWEKFEAHPYYKDSFDGGKRILPDGTTYPFLTVSDFLTDTIIQLPYKLNEKGFWGGNLNKDSKHSYLLPLTDTFFRFFTTDDLKKQMGKLPTFEMKEESNGIAVYLRIPVSKKNEFVEYRRFYFNGLDPNIENNEGGVIATYFDCTLFPNVKFTDKKDANYRFGLISNFSDKDKYKAAFGKNGKTIKVKDPSLRNETFSSNRQNKNYSIEGDDFDYIKLQYTDVNGVILPLFPKENSGNIEFTFAIDLGTTNTHIEYMTGGDTNRIKPFNIIEEERQIHWLMGEDRMVVEDYFDTEYIPEITDKEFKFPTRTALSYGEKTNWNNVNPFEKSGFAALYEKRKYLSYHNNIATDLKWSDESEKKNQAANYIESLFFLLRNKVVLNGGDLASTKIKWFYPVSMSSDRFNLFKTFWENAYKRYFGDNLNNIMAITESIAPYEYYVGDGDANNIITIDIGGGTTDIVIAPNQKIKYITSFRFAANSILGDGYSKNNRVKNGIVRQFIETIKTQLQSEIKSDKFFELFDDMKTTKSSNDIASFLFSLKDHKTVREIGENFARNIDLSEKLKEDTTQKITFIFFYTAIIYHLAKIIQVEDLNLTMPDRIVFSGNGSRLIQFFTDDADLLNTFTKLIFKKVLNDKYQNNHLSIILNKTNPKEATCLGGFFVKETESFSDIFKKKVVLHSYDNASIVKEKDTYKKAVTDDYITKTTDEAKKFVDFVFNLLPDLAREGYKLNVQSVKIAKTICYQKLDIFTQNGLKQKKQEVGENETIEETLFFYPLIGMLNALSDAICTKNLEPK
ncbi:MAG: hypothetical protein LBT29_03305 [Flavobacteriaceae bacterium]|jgi:hypothetical protein|nr:hypothetical protein [Flavobacteriaceae bacterium]